MSHTARILGVTLGLLTACLLAGSCSANGDSSASPGSGGSSGNAGNGGSGAALVDAGDGGTVLTPDSACATDQRKAEPIPLDLYIMLDKSGSMDEPVNGGTTWGFVSTALLDFVGQSPATDGIGVGIQYFPSKVPKNPCQSMADCVDGRTCFAGTCVGNYKGACSVTDYSTPDVPITVLPGGKTAIKSSLLVQGRNGGTPTSAALQGAVDYAKSWAQSHADHKVVVVLATDGDPSECDTDVGHIAAIALSAANGTPAIDTYVIGVGLNDNLKQIALAGNTTAFILDPTQDIAQQFLDTMNEIRKSALGCDYLMPQSDGGLLDPFKVNVLYTPASAQGPVTLPHAASASACDAAGGWYYDDETSPTRILICPASCTTLQADTSGTLDLLVGCATIVK